MLVAVAFVVLGGWQLVAGRRIAEFGGASPRRYMVPPRVGGAVVACLGVALLALLRPSFVRTAAPASPPRDALEAAVRARVDPLLEGGRVIGIVVGVVDSAGPRVYGFGRARLDRDGAPDGATVFELGSVTKVYTATALALLAAERRLALEDPLGAALPEPLALPAGAEDLTFADVAIHHSGLPRNPPNLGLSVRDLFPPLSDPWGRYRGADLARGLAESPLEGAPGEVFEYSNFGYGVLGVALAGAAGVSYERLIEERLCGPLGLADTRARPLTAHAPARRAHGHVVGGVGTLPWGIAVRARPWTNRALPGTGALTSTANDQLRFLAAHLASARGEGGAATGEDALGAALDRTREVRQVAPTGRPMALGWIVREPRAEEPGAPRILWHNGGTGGFRSYVGMAPDRGVGVVVLANTTEDVTRTATRLLLDLTRR